MGAGRGKFDEAARVLTAGRPETQRTESRWASADGDLEVGAMSLQNSTASRRQQSPHSCDLSTHTPPCGVGLLQALWSGAQRGVRDLASQTVKNKKNVCFLAASCFRASYERSRPIKAFFQRRDGVIARAGMKDSLFRAVSASLYLLASF